MSFTAMFTAAVATYAAIESARRRSDAETRIPEFPDPLVLRTFERQHECRYCKRLWHPRLHDSCPGCGAAETAK